MHTTLSHRTQTEFEDGGSVDVDDICKRINYNDFAGIFVV